MPEIGLFAKSKVTVEVVVRNAAGEITGYAHGTDDDYTIGRFRTMLFRLRLWMAERINRRDAR